jgi:hypothetical protein
MKKFVCVFILLFFIPVFAFSQAVTLDNALRNATTYLNGRIKPNTKVVVLNFTSDWPRLSDYIIDINIPFSSLKQPSWGKRVPFVKNSIMVVNLQRHTESASETGTSTLKVFDFEIY